MSQQPPMPQQFSTPQGSMPPQARPQQNMPQYQQQQQQQQPQQMQPTPHPQQSLPTAIHYPSGHGFPPATIEATNISQLRRKRPMARDLILVSFFCIESFILKSIGYSSSSGYVPAQWTRN